MKIDIQARDRMTSSGSAMLKAIQNTTTPNLDLLIRESIQNSLDAGFHNKDVYVDISLGDFSNQELSNVLEGTEKLLHKFEEDYQKYIMISDKNTVGLKGALDHLELEGGFGDNNLIKLVYDINKKQEAEGAGGSWGIGKTVYYRIGIGIVLYYSRIRLDNNQYEERLVAALVEDETSKDTIIEYTNRNRTGIVWWGKEHGDAGRTIPITDQQEIKSLLRIFNIEPYYNEETGTRIIIPYIDEDMLYDNAVNKESVKSHSGFYDDIEEYIYYSIQRWYAPRLNNTKYSYGKMNNLICSINQNIISDNEQEKYFKIIREMYNYAVTNDSSSLDKLLTKSKIYTKPVQINKLDYLNGRLIGTFVYGVFNYQDLSMNMPSDTYNPTFLSNLNYDEDRRNKTNSPIIMYTRQPGMIVNYQNTGEWVGNLAPRPFEEYLIGFFVLNSSNEIYFDTYEGKLTLEEHIRESEKADHLEWSDSPIIDLKRNTVHPRVVNKTKSIIVGDIRSKVYTNLEVEKVNDVTTHISNILSSSIMPPSGFGDRPNTPTRKTASNTTGISTRKERNSKIRLLYNEVVNIGNSIVVPFEITSLSRNLREVIFSLEIQGEGTNIDIAKYETDLKKSAPIYFSDISSTNNGDVVIKEQISRVSKRTHTYIFEGKFKKDQVIKGKFYISSDDKSFAPSIVTKEVAINE